MSGIFDRSALLLGDFGKMVSSPMLTPRGIQSPRMRRSSPRTPEKVQMNSSTCELKYASTDFFQLTNELRNELPVRDRYFGLKVYEKTVVGYDLAKVLIERGTANCIEEAEFVGAELIQKGFLYDAVTDGDEVFRSTYHLYRFALDDRVEAVIDSGKFELAVETFSSGMNVRDRRMGLRVQKEVFLGAEAVSFCCSHDLAANRADAEKLCQKMLNSGLFSRVTAVPKEKGVFADGVSMYRFRAPDEISECSSGELSREAASVARPSLRNILSSGDGYLELRRLNSHDGLANRMPSTKLDLRPSPHSARVKSS
mmetsp:Transcript_7939/g.21039  ORF Transcript_7939/g.21039 Transcript_7939/m.21039 type:complete len:312 (+) Transcript_7939:90-1025(+)